MSNTILKSYFTSYELAKMKLRNTPITPISIRLLAKKENWQSRKREARGGGVEYAFSSFPKNMQEEIIKKTTQMHINEQSKKAVQKFQSDVAVVGEEAYTIEQRRTLDGRLSVLKAVEDYQRNHSVTRTFAINYILGAAASGDYPHLETLFEMAQDNRGKSNDKALPSKRTVERWFDARDEGCLAPVVSQASNDIPDWLPVFLRYYQQPTKPSIPQAYEMFALNYGGDLPSIWQVRYCLKNKLGNVAIEHGRRGPKSLADISPFKRRDITSIKSGEIYIADGHTFDAEVMSPLTGKPIRPEITVIKDVGTDVIVASVASFAESALSTLSAIRMACVNHGVPSIFYVDNGSGYKNEMMADDALGLMGRLGITMTHSLPYNAKAKGKIERLHKTVFVKLAKTYPSYIGADMDKQAGSSVHRLTRKEIKKGIGYSKFIPTWDEFVSDLNKIVEAYNNAPNSAQAFIYDENGKRRRMTPYEAWAYKAEKFAYVPEKMDAEANKLDFFPQTYRTISRGEVEFAGNRYFSEALREFHGEKLPVAYDPASSQFIWIYNDKGALICQAERDGNMTDYMSDSIRAQAQERRIQNQLKRLDQKKDSLLPDNKNVIDAFAMPTVEELARGREALEAITVKDESPVSAKKVTEKAPRYEYPWQEQMSMQERYALYLRLKAETNPSDAMLKWFEGYERTSAFKTMSEMNEFDYKEKQA